MTVSFDYDTVLMITLTPNSRSQDHRKFPLPLYRVRKFSLRSVLSCIPIHRVVRRSGALLLMRIKTILTIQSAYLGRVALISVSSSEKGVGKSGVPLSFKGLSEWLDRFLLQRLSRLQVLASIVSSKVL